ncbi:nitrate reductase, partial [Acinetobacter baumannii]|nr:nitrate reductase [Acinetobacter baumannii]
IPASLIPILCVLLPQLSGLANFTWFIGMGFGFVIYRFLNQPLAHAKSAMTKVKVQ